MARVIAYPSGARAQALARTGAQVTRKRTQANTRPRPSTWPDVRGNWQPEPITWFRPAFADWQDCPDQWSDTSALWDYIPGSTTTAFIRVARTLYRNPIGAYRTTAKNTQTAAKLWQQIPENEQQAWQAAAHQLNEAAYHPIIDPRTGRPRFATTRRSTGFALFSTALHANPTTTPLPPNDPNRSEEIEMTELLTGNDYEQRMIGTLGRTDGNLTIAMYQVSPTWASPSIAASPLFDVLLAQPVKRSNCRMILGTPVGGSSLETLNQQAAQILAAAGWQVRRVPGYPVLHAKLWLIERGYVYAGSHNLSNRATTSNKEAGILTTSDATVRRARTFTTELWNAAA